jgi:hypothetical protein
MVDDGKEETHADDHDLRPYEVKKEEIPENCKKYLSHPIRYERFSSDNNGTHFLAKLGQYKAVGHTIEGAYKAVCAEHDGVPAQ